MERDRRHGPGFASPRASHNTPLDSTATRPIKPLPILATGPQIARDLRIADRGWHIFPCVPGGKRPAVDRWEQRACADPDLIARTWPGRRFNTGIATGPSGLVVIDLDPPDGRAQLEALGHEIPLTFAVATAREDGEHLYFAAIPGRVIRNSASKIAPHVDVRGSGGFVVAPGSVVDDRPYTVAGGRDPVPLPMWLADLAAPQTAVSAVAATALPACADRYGAGALRNEIARIEEAPRGSRNCQLNTSAWSLFRLAAAGLLEEAVVTAAVRAAAERCGLTADDGPAAVERTIESARSAGLADPYCRRPA